MPPQIGRVISEAVYNNQLKSNPLHPIADEVLACRFIDVPGVEKKNSSSGSIMVCFLIYSFCVKTFE
jgi:regulator of nonsense transcripts 1